ncbi:hypothetical protein Pint_22661 [Pistacia integerrima]|uniref:Uncharacterized protein n=1 Tax=Pistacia integerrima TaxID=434235 RepID=A0ACC0YL41_9ROSI|nr:hypothetical protein Pint_22661 [Pistacia integerrima]
MLSILRSHSISVMHLAILNLRKSCRFCHTRFGATTDTQRREARVGSVIPAPGSEANFLGGAASVKGVKGFDPEAAKKRFFEIYLEKGFPGPLELIHQCKSKGLKVAVASSADCIKVDANLAAAGLPISMFDAIVSADAFENLKSAPNYINMDFY